MDPRQVKTAADARAIVEERGLSHVKVGVFDVDGILRGKYMGREKFFSALEKGFGFCDVVLGWDSNDQLYDNVKLTGWHTAYPDANVRVLPDTCRAVPMEGNMLMFLGEFEGAAEQCCPRGVLRRVIQRADKAGYSVSASAEFEFFVFEETPQSVREKNYRNLKNWTPGFFGYSVLRSSVNAEFYHDLMQLGADMGLDLLGIEAGEIVPLAVVFADMRQTEPAVLVQAVARPWRAVVAGQPTAWCLADSLMRLRAIGRCQGFRSPPGHRANMCSTVWSGK